jgi:hypothetical protein
VRHDLKMRELQHQDDLKDPAGRLRRLADLDHHLKRAIPAHPPRREPLSTRMPVSSSGIAVRRRAANAGKNASRRASWQWQSSTKSASVRHGRVGLVVGSSHLETLFG